MRHARIFENRAVTRRRKLRPRTLLIGGGNRTISSTMAQCETSMASNRLAGSLALKRRTEQNRGIKHIRMLRNHARSRFKCWCRRRRRHRLVLIICSCRGLERGADDLVGALPRLVADLDVFARAWFQGGCHVVRAHEPVPGPGLVHVDEHGADQSDQGLA